MTRSIFPSNFIVDDRSKEIRKQIQDDYDAGISQNTRYWEEANTDSLLEAGDQAALNNLGFNRVLPYLDMYTFNKIKRVVSLVSGIQRKERKTIVVVPAEDGHQKTADQLTKIFFNINNNQGSLEAISDAFQSSIITGLTLVQLWIDYRSDPISGDIKVEICPFNTFTIDPSFRNANLTDCNYIWKRSYLTENECISLLPEHKKEIQDIAISSTGEDDLFPYLADDFSNISDKLAYDEYYYRSSRKQKVLIDTATGETTEYAGQDDEILPIFLKKNPTVILNEIDIPTVKLAILINGIVFYDGLNPLGIDIYPFVPIFCYKSNQVNDMYLKFQGLVRGMRDSQFLFNLATSLEVEYVQSRVNPGVVFKPTSLSDPKSVSNRDLSATIAVKKSGSMDDVRFVNPMDIPQSIPLIREQAAKEMIENDGGNEELLGSATNDNTAGILSMLRQGQGLVILKPVFDALDLSLKIFARLKILLIQSNYTPGKVKKIIEEEPTDEFYNKTFSKYDCMVEDGVLTSTQRQNQFATMMALQQGGMKLPPEIVLKASTLQNKQEIIDYMNNVAKQEAEAAQKETQVTQQLQQEEANLANARANRDNAHAAERIAKIRDNRTQALANLAEANKDDEQAALNKAKTMKELEAMDLEQLNKLVQISNVLKSAEQGDKKLLEKEVSKA